MKKLITSLACATLVISGGYAFQKVTKEEVPNGNLPAVTMQMHKSSNNAVAGEVQKQEIASRYAVKTGKESRKMRSKVAFDYNQSSSVYNLTLKSDGFGLSDVNSSELPFICDLSSPTALDEGWTIVDKNGDGTTWEYYEPTGSASVLYNSDMASDDYLVTENPIALPAGDAYIVYEFSGLSSYFKEKFEVLWGTTPNVEEMQSLSKYEELTGPAWQRELLDLTVENAGDYYFAFHAYSDADQMGVGLRYVEISTGEYVPSADIVCTGVVLPAPGVSLTSGKATVSMGNNCEVDITSFAVEWTLYRDGAEVKSGKETKDITLVPQDEKAFELNEEFDFSQVGVYELTVKAADVVADGGGAEVNTNNNSGSAKTVHFGVVDVPMSVDFADGEDPLKWYSDGGWSYYSEMSSMICDYGGKLMSQGLNLKGGSSYRIGFTYMAGMDYMGMFQTADDFSVMYSKDDADFETIQDFTNQFTDNGFVEGEVIFNCAEDGVYQFAFNQNEMLAMGTLAITSIEIAGMGDYDMAINSVSGLPTMVPASQSVLAKVSVANKGSQNSSGNLTVKLNGSQVATAPVPSIASGESKQVEVEFGLDGLEAGATANVEFSVSIDGQDDADENNNSKTVSFEITDGVLAFDQTEEYIPDHAIGLGEGTYMVAAIPIHLSEEDVLTGVSIGWGRADNQDVSLVIYKYNPDNLNTDGSGIYYYELGEKVCEVSMQQGTEVGQIEYPIAPRRLEAGDYIVGVGVLSYYIVVDNVNPGTLYLVDDNFAIDQSRANLGTPAIRPIFGEGTPANIDFTINAIVAPTGKGIFAINEPVVVNLTNNGLEEGTAVVSIKINGEDAGSQPITLDSYSAGECTFYADLSEPGVYTISANIEIDGDENPEDNSMETTVECVEPLDPYLMDFEGCADFSIDNFNPQWTTYDGDGAEAYGISGVTFPIPSGGVAFMAFNPYMTSPSLVDALPVTTPTSGERYGITFYTSTGQRNDDWLISPKLTLPDDGAALTMQVQSFNDQYGLEEYEVCVSTISNNPEDFTVVYSGVAPSDNWEEVNVDLSAYNGQDVYVAVHVISPDVFFFMVDDIEITKPVSGIDNAAAATLNLYPNPASETLVINAAGQDIESVEIYSMTGALIDTINGVGGELRYNVSALAQGLYVAKVTTSTGTQSLRFAVK